MSRRLQTSRTLPAVLMVGLMVAHAALRTADALPLPRVPIGIFLLLVVYTVHRAGLRWALALCVPMLLYALWGYAEPGTPLHYSPHALGDLLGFAVGAPVFALVTERLVRAARRERSLLAGVLQTAPEAFVHVGNDMRIRQVNAAFTTLFGYTADEVVGRDLSELLVPAEALEASRAIVQRATRSGEEVDIEGWRRRKDGGLVYVWAVGSPVVEHGIQVGRVVFYRDITAQAQAVTDLRVKEAAIQAASTGIALASPEGTITYWNPAMGTMWRIAPEKMIGRPAWEPWAQPEAAAAAVRASESTGHWDGELLARRFDGTTFWAHVVSNRVDDERGNPIAQLASITDVTATREAEAALRDSEALYADAFDRSPDGKVLVGLNGAVLRVNAEICRITGYTVEELRQKNVYDVLHPDEVEADQAQGRRLLAGAIDTWESEQRLRHKDGHDVWVQVKRSLVTRREDGSPLHVVVRVQDITERRRQAQALVQAQEHLQHYLSASPAVIFSASAADGFRVGFISGNAQAVYGMSAAAILADPTAWAARVHPEDRARMDEAWAATCRGTTAAFEFRWRMESGDDHWFYHETRPVLGPDGGVVEVVGAVSDVTDLRRAEADLRHSEERFRLITETIDDVFWMADPAIQSMLYISPAYEKVWGRTRQSLYENPQSFLDAVVSEDRERVQHMLTAQKTGDSFNYEYRIRDAAGAVKTIWDRGYPVRDADGTVWSYVGIARDVTSSRRLEARVREGERLESIGRLAGGIAHDFNNLLTVIHTTASVAAMDAPEGGALRADLADIQQAAESASSLTGQLLAFSRMQTLQPVPVDLNDLVGASVKMLRRVISEDIELVVVPHDGRCVVEADPGQLSQVVVNLAVNARDAMLEGGTLTIETSCVDVNELDAEILEVPAGPYAQLTVSDTGHGMTDETMRRIWEPFFTTKPDGKGTGLGLATVYGIVKQSGGSVAVSSVVGTGTTFRIYLPAKTALTPKPEEGEAELDVRGHETVLLVDDNASVRGATKRLLERMGYVIIEATDPEHAIQTCAGNGRKIHLLLTDVVMPQMNGVELAQRIRQIKPDLGILFMSGYGADVLGKNGQPEGSFHYIQKPLRPDTLATAIRQAIDSRPRKAKRTSGGLRRD